MVDGTNRRNLEDIKRTVEASLRAYGDAREGADRVSLVPTESAPEFDVSGARIGWSASARESEAEPADWTLLTYAVCAEL